MTFEDANDVCAEKNLGQPLVAYILSLLQCIDPIHMIISRISNLKTLKYTFEVVGYGLSELDAGRTQPQGPRTTETDTQIDRYVQERKRELKRATESNKDTGYQ